MRSRRDAEGPVVFMFGASGTLLPSRRRRRRAMLHLELCDALNQVVGDRLIERKLQIPLGPRVARDRLPELRVTRHGWIEPDVVPEGGEVDQGAVQSEGGNAIADRLLRIGCDGADRAP